MRRLGWILALGFSACGASGSGTKDSGTNIGPGGPDCPFSTAKSGTSCQANWFCDGGERAAYCGRQSDGGYDCACGAAATNPKHFAGTNACEQDGDELLRTIAQGCGF